MRQQRRQTQEAKLKRSAQRLLLMQMERQRLVQQKQKSKEIDGVKNIGFSATSEPLGSNTHDNTESNILDMTDDEQHDNDEEDDDIVPIPTKRSSKKVKLSSTSSPNRQEKLQRLIRSKTTKHSTTRQQNTNISESSDDIITNMTDDDDEEGGGFMIDNTNDDSSASKPISSTNTTEIMLDNKGKRLPHFEETEHNENIINDDEYIPILPQNTDDIDLGVLASLPSHMQKDYVDALQRQVRSENRGKLIPVAAHPESFSQQQLQSYIKSSKINLRIDAMNAEAAKKFMSGKRIASEANREYVLEKDEGYTLHSRHGYGISNTASGSTPTPTLPIMQEYSDTLTNPNTELSSSSLGYSNLHNDTPHDDEEGRHFTLGDILGKESLEQLQIGQQQSLMVDGSEISSTKELTDREKLSLYYGKNQFRYSRDNSTTSNDGNRGSWRGRRGRGKSILSSLNRVYDKRAQDTIATLLPSLNSANKGISARYDELLKQQQGLGISGRLMKQETTTTSETNDIKTEEPTITTIKPTTKRITVAGVSDLASPEYTDQFRLRLDPINKDNVNNVIEEEVQEAIVDVSNIQDDNYAITAEQIWTNLSEKQQEEIIPNYSEIDVNNSDHNNVKDNVIQDTNDNNDEELRHAIEMSLQPVGSTSVNININTNDNDDDSVDGGGFIMEDEGIEFKQINDVEEEEEWEDIVEDSKSHTIAQPTQMTVEQLEALRWLEDDNHHHNTNTEDIVIELDSSNNANDSKSADVSSTTKKDEVNLLPDTEVSLEQPIIVSTSSDFSKTNSTEEALAEALGTAGQMAQWAERVMRRELRRMNVIPHQPTQQPIQQPPPLPSTVTEINPPTTITTIENRNPTPIITSISPVLSTDPPKLTSSNSSSGTTTPNKASSDDSEIVYISAAANKLANIIDLTTKSSNNNEDNDDEDNTLLAIQHEMFEDLFTSPTAQTTTTTSSSRSFDQPMMYFDKGRENSILAAIEAEESALRLDVRTGARDSEVITESMRNEVMALLDLFGVPYIIAPMEAEAQCAALEAAGLVDGVITDDSDAFLFGSRLVYKNIFEDKKHVEVYRSDDIERELGLCRDDLIRGALLLGSDYTNGVKGVGIVNAVEILRCFPEDKGLEEFRDWLHSVEPDNRKLSKQEKEKLDPKERFKFTHRSARKNWDINEGFPNRAVLMAYRNPTVTNFTNDKFNELLQWKLPNLDGLRLVSMDKFGWTLQQSNEHLLPVIKELTQKSYQTSLENYMVSYHDNVKVAKIRSKRMRSAVAGLRGDETDDVPDLAYQETPSINVSTTITTEGTNTNTETGEINDSDVSSISEDQAKTTKPKDKRKRKLKAKSKNQKKRYTEAWTSSSESE